MMMINKFSDFMETKQELDMPSKLGFVYDSEENEYDREDLNLCLCKIEKMDMYEPRWTLTKFDDDYEDGEYIVFKGTENEMEEFVLRYIRESKFKDILDNV